VLAAQAVGSPETVARRLAELVEMTGADEVMATTPVTDQDARDASLRALARLAAAAPERS
jgi:alkanesulfonate monooxygenase SsuD/methylene tetrahydromethanopterin reductase-like flavin-dependent oxidoreductase (luciferase family)